MSDTHWDSATCQSRIKDVQRRERHAAGSPDAADLAAYALELHAVRDGTALVLGMTPELRTLALRYVARVTAADASAAALALYRDWVVLPPGHDETLLHADWFELPRRAPGRYDIILGDGIFGNLPDAATHARLLHTVQGLLRDDGRFVTRMALLAEPEEREQYRHDRLLQQFRAGAIDAAEFGLTLRLSGFHAECYDADTQLLDNRCVFTHCERAAAAGLMTAQELAVVRRYYFSGRNCLLPRAQWEDLLTRAGFGFTVTTVPDKLWRRYYPVYSCRKLTPA